ncbi:MAG: hypothetical protein ACKOWN_03140 [Microbacteriaceae bacterium]
MIRRYLAPGLGRRVGVVAAVIAIAVQVLVLAVGAWAFVNRPAIRDWLVVGKVAASTTLDDYVEQAGMSSAGRFYLYASKPELHTAATFARSCPAKESGVAVLGCYIIATDRIHLLDITDPAFDTMEPVVAAHEMLHAVWARFSDAERTRVANAVKKSYAQINDPDLAERLTVYEDASGNIDVAELFAVMGTEVALVSDELGEIYNRYFDRRGAVVALAAEAADVISTIVDEIARVSSEIVTLEQTIATKRDEYTTAMADVTADVATFNKHAAEPGYYQSQSDFDNDRNALKKREADLEKARIAINAMIDQFNLLVTQLDVLNSQAMALNEALGVDVSVMTPVTVPESSP